jgi:hypothetical protein
VGVAYFALNGYRNEKKKWSMATYIVVLFAASVIFDINCTELCLYCNRSCIMFLVHHGLLYNIYIFFF